MAVPDAVAPPNSDDEYEPPPPRDPKAVLYAGEPYNTSSTREFYKGLVITDMYSIKQIIRKGDTVLLQAGPGELPYICQVHEMWRDIKKGEPHIRGVWFYRLQDVPEDTPMPEALADIAKKAADEAAWIKANVLNTSGNSGSDDNDDDDKNDVDDDGVASSSSSPALEHTSKTSTKAALSLPPPVQTRHLLLSSEKFVNSAETILAKAVVTYFDDPPQEVRRKAAAVELHRHEVHAFDARTGTTSVGTPYFPTAFRCNYMFRARVYIPEHRIIRFDAKGAKKNQVLQEPLPDHVMQCLIDEAKYIQKPYRRIKKKKPKKVREKKPKKVKVKKPPKPKKPTRMEIREAKRKQREMGELAAVPEPEPLNGLVDGETFTVTKRRETKPAVTRTALVHMDGSVAKVVNGGRQAALAEAKRMMMPPPPLPPPLGAPGAGISACADVHDAGAAHAIASSASTGLNETGASDAAAVGDGNQLSAATLAQHKASFYGSARAANVMGGPPNWHDEERDRASRCTVIRNIFGILEKRKSSKNPISWEGMAKLSHQLEIRLYRRTVSRQVYAVFETDPAYLEQHLALLAREDSNEQSVLRQQERELKKARKMAAALAQAAEAARRVSPRRKGFDAGSSYATPQQLLQQTQNGSDEALKVPAKTGNLHTVTIVVQPAVFEESLLYEYEIDGGTSFMSDGSLRTTERAKRKEERKRRRVLRQLRLAEKQQQLRVDGADRMADAGANEDGGGDLSLHGARDAATHGSGENGSDSHPGNDIGGSSIGSGYYDGGSGDDGNNSNNNSMGGGNGNGGGSGGNGGNGMPRSTSMLASGVGHVKNQDSRSDWNGKRKRKKGGGASNEKKGNPQSVRDIVMAGLMPVFQADTKSSGDSASTKVKAEDPGAVAPNPADGGLEVDDGLPIELMSIASFDTPEEAAVSTVADALAVETFLPPAKLVGLDKAAALVDDLRHLNVVAPEACASEDMTRQEKRLCLREPFMSPLHLASLNAIAYANTTAGPMSLDDVRRELAKPGCKYRNLPQVIEDLRRLFEGSNQWLNAQRHSRVLARVAAMRHYLEAVAEAVEECSLLWAE